MTSNALATTSQVATIYPPNGKSLAWTVTTSAGTPWAPTGLTSATLPLWLAADAISSTNGTRQAAWNDSSGNSHHWAQSTTGKQPRWDTAVQNGLPGLLFDNARQDQFTSSGQAAISASAGFGFFIVFRPITSSDNYGCLLTYNGGNGWFYRDGTQKVDIYYSSDHSAGTAFSYGTTGIYGHTCTSSGAGTHYRNGVADGTVSSEATFTPNYIGSDNGGESLHGYIFEIIVTAGALSSAEREKIEGYLAWKWGTVAALDSGHPYKTAAPLA